MSHNHHDDNSFQLGFMSLIVGFVAGAAAVILSDPDKREKVVEIVDKTKATTLNTVNKVAEAVKDKTGNLQSQLNDVVTKAEDVVNKEIDKIESKEL
jgi:chemotaxis regulatin CheY-phosphate phosphatase CheZ